MRTIDIQINQAKILSFNVDLEDEKPQVSATVGLYSGTRQISSFTLRTQSYFGNNIKFTLPIDMIEPIVDIAKQLEIILVRECNKQLKRLPEVIENDTVAKPAGESKG